MKTKNPEIKEEQEWKRDSNVAVKPITYYISKKNPYQLINISKEASITVLALIMKKKQAHQTALSMLPHFP